MIYFDFRALIKYFLEGLGIGIILYILKTKITLEEILLIALSAGAVFALLDQFTPMIGASARQGAGFGIGVKFVQNGIPEGFDDDMEDDTDC